MALRSRQLAREFNRRPSQPKRFNDMLGKALAINGAFTIALICGASHAETDILDMRPGGIIDLQPPKLPVYESPLKKQPRQLGVIAGMPDVICSIDDGNTYLKVAGKSDDNTPLIGYVDTDVGLVYDKAATPNC